jgi:hypothetical protein
MAVDLSAGWAQARRLQEVKSTMSSEVLSGGGLPLEWLVAPAAAFNHPDDVLSHSGLTVSEKRAILASSASDAHAVDDMPWLRQLECGARIPLSDVLSALRSLDAEEKRTGLRTAEAKPLASALRKAPCVTHKAGRCHTFRALSR